MKPIRNNVMVQRLIEDQNNPPLTTNYEKENFQNMNIFSKIQELPNKKNSRITEKIRKIIRKKVRKK